MHCLILYTNILHPRSLAVVLEEEINIKEMHVNFRFAYQVGAKWKTE